jgi:hypothetical protein
MTWGEVGRKAASALPGSARKFGEDLIHPFTSWDAFTDTIGGIGGVISGAGAKVVRPALRRLQESSGVPVSPQLQQPAEAEQFADAFGQMYKEKYGSIEKIKRSLATDPVGVLADVSMVAAPAGGALTRLPVMGGRLGELAAAGRGVGQVLRRTDPLTAAGTALGGAFKLPQVGAAVLSGKGYRAIEEAQRAGREGGEAAAAYKAGIHGQDTLEAIARDALKAKEAMYRERGQEYVTKMAGVKQNTTPLDWKEVDKALADITKIQTHTRGGVTMVTDKATQAIRQQIGQEVQAWKQAYPSPVASDLDALKQTIGNFENVVPHTPQAAVVKRAQDALRSTIIKNYPQYGSIMDAYHEFSTQLRDLEKALSLKDKAGIDTTTRKLMSALRDNVNTNFGERARFVDILERYGAKNLMTRLAAQALKPGMPSGLGQYLGGEILSRIGLRGASEGARMAGPAAAAGAGAFGVGGGLLGAVPAALGTAAMSSPRVMGTAAFEVGRARKLLEPRSVGAQAARPAAYEVLQMANKLNPREVVQEEAREALREKKENGFTDAEVKILRRASSPKAMSDDLLRARSILERASMKGIGGPAISPTPAPPASPMPAPFAPSPGLRQAQTPAPGEASQPPQQYGGPI